MSEQLVIVPLVRGVADLRVLHHPAVSIREPYRTVTLKARMERNHGIPPYEWPSVCGVVGVVYAKGGPLGHRPFCNVCSVALAEREPQSGSSLVDSSPGSATVLPPLLSLSPSAKEAA